MVLFEKRKTKGDRIYRARGIYAGTSKESFLTKVWRRTEAEAKSDIDTLGQRYSNTKIISKDWALFVNKRHKLKHPLPRY